jgi:hypothetical protein
MRKSTPSFRDDADAEQHLIRHLRRMLLVCYYQDTVSEHTITEEHIADAFAHNERFRRHLDLQGINPDTLTAFTDEGRTIEFISIKSLDATGSSAPGNYAGHSRVPSPDHGYPASINGCGL